MRLTQAQQFLLDYISSANNKGRGASKYELTKAYEVWRYGDNVPTNFYTAQKSWNMYAMLQTLAKQGLVVKRIDGYWLSIRGWQEVR